MTALAANRDIPRHGEQVKLLPNGMPVKGSVTIFKGALVSNDGGFLRPARATAADVVVGVSEENVVNAGADGAKSVGRILRDGVWAFVNSSAGDAIGNAEIGKVVYAVDDQTVAKTDGSGARPAAGKCVGMDGALVLVEVG